MRRVRSQFPQSIFRLAAGRRGVLGVAVMGVVFALSAAPASAALMELGVFADNGPGDGGAGSGNGQLRSPGAADVHTATGRLYVADTGNNRVQVFAPTANGGTYYSQVPVSAPTGLAVDQSSGSVYVSTASGVSKFDSNLTPVGGFSFVESGALAVDPTNGDLLVADLQDNLIRRYSSSGTPGATFAAARPLDVAVDSTGDVIVVTSTGDIINDCGASSAVERFSSAGVSEGAIGSLDAPGVVAADPDGDRVVVGAQVNQYNCDDGTVDPLVATFAPDGTPGSSVTLPGPPHWATISGLAAVGGGSTRVYAVTKSPFDDAYGQTGVHVLADVEAPAVTIAPSFATSATTATFSGTVDPNGYQTSFHFEYRRIGTTAWSSTPTEDAGFGTAPVPVSASVDFAQAGLGKGASYEARLVASNIGGSDTSDAPNPTFLTQTARPSITGQMPVSVEKTKAILRARINPNGEATTYYFELGADTGYGTRIPADFDPLAGSGPDPVTVNVSRSGLEENTVYHYRVVASNSKGTTVSPDRRFSTLNDDGLAWGRRLELVSPADKGPTGRAWENVGLGGSELQYQASSDGEAITYSLSYGGPDSTSGGEVAYRSDRSPGGWIGSQVAPSMTGTPQPGMGGEGNIPGRFNHWVSNDLACGFSVSSLPLTDDAVAQTAVDAGGFNLYRRRADGGYDLVTNLAPTNPGAANIIALDAYLKVSAAQDCSRVVFNTQFRYSGLPLTLEDSNNGAIYDWRDGALGNPTAIPGPSGPEFPARAVVGSVSLATPSLSDDGSRFFFSAVSRLGGDLGRNAVFVSELGEPTVDASQSQTATPNNGNSFFQMATPDGDEVFFIARYGLAANGSSSGASSCNLTSGGNYGIGCDLYRYSVETGTLTDLSASPNPSDAVGASVAGVLDASDDGSRVYFAAKGQLVAGEGQTYGENTAASTRGYNVYLWDSGALSYVATVTQTDATNTITSGMGAGMLVNGPVPQAVSKWASRATPDGDYLVFQSQRGSNVLEAYRYSVASGETECVSCRRDGQSSLGSGDVSPPLPYLRQRGGGGTVSISPDGSVVFFVKRDPLAPGALEGQLNLYEWHDGQITLLVSDIPNTDTQKAVEFSGASEDGSSVFFRTKRRLVPQDVDGSQDVYVARVGGGFGELPPPASECVALSGGCQGGGAEAVSGDAKTSSPAQSDNAATEARKTLAVSSLSVKARRRASRTGRLALSVRTSSPGRISLTVRARLGRRLTRVGGVAKRARKPGSVKLITRLSSAARKRLSSGRNLRLTAEVRQPGARARSITILLPGVKS